MNKLLLEKSYPYAMAAASTLIWWKFDIQLPKGDGVLGSSLTIGAILTGFLATAKAILMSLDSPVMQRLRNTNYLSDLTSYLGAAIWLSFAFCCLSLLGYFGVALHKWYGLMWIFIGVSAACSFVRVTDIMLRILRHSGNGS